MIGSASIIGNPLDLLYSLAGGVMELFAKPAQGFLSDGMVGLGLGVAHGAGALVHGVFGGALMSLSRITGERPRGLHGTMSV